MRLVASNRANIPSFPPSLGIREVARREKRRHGGRAAEYDVRVAHVFLEQPLILAVIGRQDAGF